MDNLSEVEKRDIAEAVFDALPLELGCVVAEGYLFKQGFIKEKIVAIARDKRVRVWDLSCICE